MDSQRDDGAFQIEQFLDAETAVALGGKTPALCEALEIQQGEAPSNLHPQRLGGAQHALRDLPLRNRIVKTVGQDGCQSGGAAAHVPFLNDYALLTNLEERTHRRARRRIGAEQQRV